MREQVDADVTEHVTLSKLDLLRAVSGEQKPDDVLLVASSKFLLSSGCGKLFTKQGILKRSLGTAHKGWRVTDFDNDESFYETLCKKFESHSRVTIRLLRRMLV